MTLARDDGLFDAGYTPLHSPHPLVVMLKGGSKKNAENATKKKKIRKCEISAGFVADAVPNC